MNRTSASRGSVFNRLSARLLGLIGLVLLPLGLISVYQTWQVVSETERLRNAALLAKTQAAAQAERELILQVLGMATGLSASVNIDDMASCSQEMGALVSRAPQLVFAGYIREDASMACASEGAFRDLSQSAAVARALSSGEPIIDVSASASFTGRPIMYVLYPVERKSERRGLVAVSMPLTLADKAALALGGDDGLSIITLARSGAVIAAEGGRAVAEALLPREFGVSDLENASGRTFLGKTASGQARSYAIVEMAEADVYIVGTWPAVARVAGVSILQGRIAILFPFVMWFCVSLVAYFGLKRLVITHVKRLSSAMRRFALGERGDAELRLVTPPTEIGDAERAFNRMARIITDAEERQQSDLHDKEVLLKEVHHRVKNNLQLIASIMNMQHRSAKSAEAKKILSGLQRRVSGLALLHRTLYTSPDLTTINSRDLLEAVVDDTSQLSAGLGLRMSTEIADIEIYPDQAVPLSMFLAEALTNAIKYAGAAKGQKPEVKVLLSYEAQTEHISLEVTNTKGPATQAPTVDDDLSDGLGTRLMAAFKGQLDGEGFTEETEARFVSRLSFERRNFEKPEQVT